MKRILILAIAVAGASFSLKAQGGAGRGATDAAAANPLAGNAQAIEQGRDIYNRTCTTCHGPDGAGGEMGPALWRTRRAGTRWRPTRKSSTRSRAAFAGRRCRHSAAACPDNDVWKVTAYIRGLRGTAIDAPAVGRSGARRTDFLGQG
jgi:mono/diheme cytochrome c family protein